MVERAERIKSYTDWRCEWLKDKKETCVAKKRMIAERINEEDMIFNQISAYGPEQYIVTDGKGKSLGYVRIKRRYFEVYCPDAGSEDDAIFTAEVECGYDEIENLAEVELLLWKAKIKIRDWWNEKNILLAEK